MSELKNQFNPGIRKTLKPDSTQASSSNHLIVIGNEKGGAGKSTIAIHLSMALMRMNFRVGVIDLDIRQKTLSRYLENRKDWSEKNAVSLPSLFQLVLNASQERNLDQAETEDQESWMKAIQILNKKCNFTIIDVPGAYSHLSWLAHCYADTIITPINDSFVDFDLLAQVDPETYEVIKPSYYSEMIWNCRKQKAALHRGVTDWVVLRNRMSMIDARNKRRIGRGLQILSKRVGFRVIPGFSERVIYREMFPSGLTLLDIRESNSEMPVAMSHIAARQELRELVLSLELNDLSQQKLTF